MDNSQGKLKSWGLFFAGLGILLIGIAVLINVLKHPSRLKFADLFGPPGTETITRTVRSFDSAPPSTISPFQKIITDEEFNEYYESLKEALSEWDFKEIILEKIESEEFKEKLRRKIEELPAIMEIKATRVEEIYQ